MEIKLDILHAVASGEAKPTRIMYRSMVPWDQLQTHLEFLTENEYIIEKNQSANIEKNWIKVQRMSIILPLKENRLSDTSEKN